MLEDWTHLGVQACREWATLSSFTVRTIHQWMEVGLASVEEAFCSQPNSFFGTHANENLHMLELPVWLVTINSLHIQNSQHLWRLFSGPLKSEFLDVSDFILATVISLLPVLPANVSFQETQPGNGLWHIIWLYCAKNKWLSCSLAPDELMNRIFGLKLW